MKEQAISKKRHYSELFKRKVIEEYLHSGQSKMSLLKKYDIKMKSGIQRWMQQLGYEDIHQKARYLIPNITSKLANNKPFNSAPVSEQSLESRVKELERQLED